MKAILRGLLFLLVGLGLALTALWVVGPYEPVDTEISFDPASIPSDIDGWLADSEGRVPNLRDGSEKTVLWAGAPGRRTDLAIVYLHGFSADPWEIRPVPERVAEALGANIFFQRLTGHGSDGAALAQATAGDWLEDVAEAMEVGRRLGDRVIVMSGSTGGTLSAILAADPGMAEAREGLAGLIMVSPNFKVANPAAALLSLPAARYWVPLIAGETRRFEPQNDRHAAHWTHEYPTTAVVPLQALVDYAATLDYSATAVPALFHFSDDDTVVDPVTTREVAAVWGGDVTLEVVTVGPDDDPYSHVIAGDILSPGQTQAAIAGMTDWIRGL